MQQREILNLFLDVYQIQMSLLDPQESRSSQVV